MVVKCGSDAGDVSLGFGFQIHKLASCIVDAYAAGR
jgi:hypothetical protein